MNPHLIVKKIIPPQPPKGRIQCASCGYTADKSKYHTEHSHCPQKRFIKVLFISVIVMFIVITIALASKI